MLPSRIILAGILTSAVGLAAQVVLDIVSSRLVEGISSTIAATHSLPDSEADKALDQIHYQSGLLFVGSWAAWVFIALGLILLVVGIYRNAKATERLQRQHPQA